MLCNLVLCAGASQSPCSEVPSRSLLPSRSTADSFVEAELAALAGRLVVTLPGVRRDVLADTSLLPLKDSVVTIIRDVTSLLCDSLNEVYILS